MVNGSKSGNGRQTLLISQVSTAVTPPAAITISGTQIPSQRTETAPPALPPPTPRLKKPRPGALRPAASQASASSALTSKTTGSGPATSDQSSGFIPPSLPFWNAPACQSELTTLVPPAWFRGMDPPSTKTVTVWSPRQANDQQLCRSPEAKFVETRQGHLLTRPAYAQLRRRSSDRIIKNGHGRRGCHPAALL